MKMDLKEYYQYQHSTEDMQKLYYNMSTAMKYIHEHDYCIKSFNLNDIEILDTEKESPIRYKTVIKMPLDQESQLIREDIYNIAFIQIGIYSGTFDYLKPKFLKENFDMFAEFLPQDDVPYFRGIVERGASVYYCDFVAEKTRREVEALQKEVGEGSSTSMGIQKKKATSIGSAFADKDTRNLYRDLDDKRQAAFVSFLILPIAMIVLGAVLSIALFIG